MYAVEGLEDPKHASPEFHDVVFFARRVRIFKVLFQVSLVGVLQNKIVVASLNVISIKPDQVRVSLSAQLSKGFNLTFVVSGGVRREVGFEGKCIG
jgi:hypothetical protein